MSTLDTNALIKSAGIGAVVTLALAIITNAAGLVSPQLALLSIVCCCVAYLFFVAIGAGYALFAKQNGKPMEPGPMALGGAIAALIAGVVMGIVNTIATLVFGAQMITQTMTQFQTADVPAGMMEGSMAVGLMIGLCLVLIFSAGFGAAGGAIYAAVTKERPSAPAV
jgi:hypothetical protein